MIIVRIITGIVFIVLGLLVLKFVKPIVENIGRMWTVENKLGPGSTYYVYQGLGLLLIMFGLIYMIGFETFFLDPLRNFVRNLFRFG